MDPLSVGIPVDAHTSIEVGVWCAAEISAEERGFLACLPQTFEMDLGVSARLRGFHGFPRSYDDVIQASTSEDGLAAMLVGHDQQILAGGHTHVPLSRRVFGQTLVNPRSVGLPFDRYGYAGSVAVLTQAGYGLIDTKGGSVSIELRQASIDLARLEDLVRSSDMPMPIGGSMVGHISMSSPHFNVRRAGRFRLASGRGFHPYRDPA